MIRGFLHGAEYRALNGTGQEQPGPRDVPVLRVGRLLVVNQAPDLIESLLADEPREKPSADRYGDEEQLGHAGCIPELTAGSHDLGAMPGVGLEPTLSGS